MHKATPRVAIVTGAAGGIGSAVCRALAHEGVTLVLADTRPPAALAKDLATRGATALAVSCDVRDAQQIKAMVDVAMTHFGRIDILVNVAGVVSTGSAEDLAQTEWQRVLDINLTGTFLCCQAVIPTMRAQQHGRIVNIGSVLGKNGGNARPWLDRSEQNQAGNVAYGVTKAGVHTMTVYLARELAADGITVNAVAPGPIASDMTSSFPATLRALIPVGRMGTAEEVADAIVFLCSPKSAFITGEILDVNGGLFCD